MNLRAYFLLPAYYYHGIKELGYIHGVYNVNECHVKWHLLVALVTRHKQI